MQKLLSFIKSHLFIFAFISTTLEDGSKKIVWQLMSKSVVLGFPGGSDGKESACNVKECPA